MTVWYIRKTGNDTTGDGSTGNPWLTVLAAIAKAEVVNGDTLTIGDGTYTQNLVITKQLKLIGENDRSLTINSGLVSIAESNVTLEKLTMTNIINIGTGDLSGLSLENLTFENIVTAGTAFSIRHYASNSVTNLQILNSAFASDAHSYIIYQRDNGAYVDGFMISNSTFTTGSGTGTLCFDIENGPLNVGGIKRGFKNGTISNCSFSDWKWKALYFEGLDNVVITGCDFTNVGWDPTRNSGCAIDINVKYHNYSNVQILNNTITGCGTGHIWDCGIMIKARCAGGYAPPNDATLTGVLIANNTITACGIVDGIGGAVRIGEPTDGVMGPEAQPAGISIHNNCIHDNIFDYDIIDVRDTALSPDRIDALFNSWGTVDPAVIVPRMFGKVDYAPYCTNCTYTHIYIPSQLRITQYLTMYRLEDNSNPSYPGWRELSRNTDLNILRDMRDNIISIRTQQRANLDAGAVWVPVE